MVAPAPPSPPSDHYDLVILGGAFTGSSLGLLMRRKRPGTRVLILEKSTVFDRKVGESTSEVGGCFLTRVLGLSHYLAREHVQKHGLRMWFNREPNDDPGRCGEIGPLNQARFPTYQLDRQNLDEHLIALAAAEGCEVIRGAAVKSFRLDGAGNNRVAFKTGSEVREIGADWLADCSGKAALVARERRTLKALDGHPVHSMWVRFRGVTDLDSHEARSVSEGIAANPTVVGRTTATNHLMGHGWWAWIIPLANGEFSAGVTWDERLATPPAEGPVGQRVKQHLLTHPIGRLMFERAEPIENDARVYKNLPYYSTEVCGDGWIAAGDAAGFMDPLYSQGLDYCAHGAYSAQKILGRALDGEEVGPDLVAHGKQFVQSYHRWFRALYLDKYGYLGDSDLMNAAFLLDIGTYFIGPVQLVYRSTDSEFSKMPYHGRIGAGFARFMAFYNRRLGRIARKRLKVGRYGIHNLDSRRLISISFDANFKAFGHIMRGVRRWLRLELETAFIRLPAKPAATSEPAASPAPESAETAPNRAVS
jgi:flavin-dependent dehydrogenase